MVYVKIRRIDYSDSKKKRILILEWSNIITKNIDNIEVKRLELYNTLYT